MLEELGEEPQQERRIKLGVAISFSAASTLTTPLPSFTCMRSAIASIGSPKNLSPP